mmetsp:Transcript_86239/g.241203  ORF Transcript_86239/g.241203 Transcript_86239/m.241203 type:complete len:212 (+) Transcript_86239:1319-1954(+)
MDVQVVRGLVKEKQVRRDEEGLRKCDAHSPSATEFLCGPLLVLACEAEASEDHSSASLGILIAEFVQPLVHLHEPDATNLWFLAGTIVLVFQELLLHVKEPHAFFVRLQNALQHFRVVAFDFLLHMHHQDVLGDGHAAIALRHGAQQSALPDAVAADETILLAMGKPEVRVVKKLLAASEDDDFSDVDVHGHADLAWGVRPCSDLKTKLIR